MTTDEHIHLFMSCFAGRTDAYGTYDPRTGKVRQVKESVGDAVVRAHLDGRRPFGLYLLTKDTIRVSAVDFDVDDGRLPLEFTSRLRDLGLPSYVERSKSKGYHVWVFYSPEGVKARTARLVLRSVLVRMGQQAVEVFPKQDSLDANTFYGNFINLPLFGPLVCHGRCVFVDANLVPFADQWSVLAGIERVSADVLARARARLGCAVETPPSVQSQAAFQRQGPQSGPTTTYALYPCAQRMLKEGVPANQRAACFRLAVQLRKAGLPFDYSVLVLAKWAGRNHPHDGRSVITHAEVVSQTRCAYRYRTYRGCGCDDPAVMPFCDPTACPLGRNRRADQTNAARTARGTSAYRRA